MRRFVDLHTHSSASDGDLGPGRIIRRAESGRLAAVALTDHDTLDGLLLARGQAEALQVRFVPGIEISARFTGGTLHLLGLGIDPASRELAETARTLRKARDQRNPRMIERLRELGVDVSMDELLDVALAARGDFDSRQAGGASMVVSRLHMARLLNAKGCVRTVAEAFDRYLGCDGPAFVEKENLTPAEAIEAIHSAGGLAVLAHPVALNCANSAMLHRVVRSLLGDGLDGIEVYHSNHSPGQVRSYLDIARRLGLLVSGGSDFHGPARPGVELGSLRIPIEAVEQLLARIAR